MIRPSTSITATSSPIVPVVKHSSAAYKSANVTLLSTASTPHDGAMSDNTLRNQNNLKIFLFLLTIQLFYQSTCDPRQTGVGVWCQHATIFHKKHIRCISFGNKTVNVEHQSIVNSRNIGLETTKNSFLTTHYNKLINTKRKNFDFSQNIVQQIVVMNFRVQKHRIVAALTTRDQTSAFRRRLRSTSTVY